MEEEIKEESELTTAEQEELRPIKEKISLFFEIEGIRQRKKLNNSYSNDSFYIKKSNNYNSYSQTSNELKILKQQYKKTQQNIDYVLDFLNKNVNISQSFLIFPNQYINLLDSSPEKTSGELSVINIQSDIMYEYKILPIRKEFITFIWKNKLKSWLIESLGRIQNEILSNVRNTKRELFSILQGLYFDIYGKNENENKSEAEKKNKLIFYLDFLNGITSKQPSKWDEKEKEFFLVLKNNFPLLKKYKLIQKRFDLSLYDAIPSENVIKEKIKTVWDEEFQENIVSFFEKRIGYYNFPLTDSIIETIFTLYVIFTFDLKPITKKDLGFISYDLNNSEKLNFQRPSDFSVQIIEMKVFLSHFIEERFFDLFDEIVFSKIDPNILSNTKEITLGEFYTMEHLKEILWIIEYMEGKESKKTKLMWFLYIKLNLEKNVIGYLKEKKKEKSLQIKKEDLQFKKELLKTLDQYFIDNHVERNKIEGKWNKELKLSYFYRKKYKPGVIERISELKVKDDKNNDIVIREKLLKNEDHPVTLKDVYFKMNKDIITKYYAPMNERITHKNHWWTELSEKPDTNYTSSLNKKNFESTHFIQVLDKNLNEEYNNTNDINEQNYSSLLRLDNNIQDKFANYTRLIFIPIWDKNIFPKFSQNQNTSINERKSLSGYFYSWVQNRDQLSNFFENNKSKIKENFGGISPSTGKDIITARQDLFMLNQKHSNLKEEIEKKSQNIIYEPVDITVQYTPFSTNKYKICNEEEEIKEITKTEFTIGRNNNYNYNYNNSSNSNCEFINGIEMFVTLRIKHEYFEFLKKKENKFRIRYIKFVWMKEIIGIDSNNEKDQELFIEEIYKSPYTSYFYFDFALHLKKTISVNVYCKIYIILTIIHSEKNKENENFGKELFTVKLNSVFTSEFAIFRQKLYCVRCKEIYDAEYDNVCIWSENFTKKERKLLDEYTNITKEWNQLERLNIPLYESSFGYIGYVKKWIELRNLIIPLDRIKEIQKEFFNSIRSSEFVDYASRIENIEIVPIFLHLKYMNFLEWEIEWKKRISNKIENIFNQKIKIKKKDGTFTILFDIKKGEEEEITEDEKNLVIKFNNIIKKFKLERKDILPTFLKEKLKFYKKINKKFSKIMTFFETSLNQYNNFIETMLFPFSKKTFNIYPILNSKTRTIDDIIKKQKIIRDEERNQTNNIMNILRRLTLSKLIYHEVWNHVDSIKNNFSFIKRNGKINNNIMNQQKIRNPFSEKSRFSIPIINGYGPNEKNWIEKNRNKNKRKRKRKFEFKSIIQPKSDRNNSLYFLVDIDKISSIEKRIQDIYSIQNNEKRQWKDKHDPINEFHNISDLENNIEASIIINWGYDFKMLKKTVKFHYSKFSNSLSEFIKNKKIEEEISNIAEEHQNIWKEFIFFKIKYFGENPNFDSIINFHYENFIFYQKFLNDLQKMPKIYLKSISKEEPLTIKQRKIEKIRFPPIDNLENILYYKSPVKLKSILKSYTI